MPNYGVDNNNGKTNSKVANVLLVKTVASVAFASAHIAAASAASIF